MAGRDVGRIGSYDCGTLWNGHLASMLEADTAELFRAIDINGDNRVSKEEFIHGLTQAPNVDLFDTEAARLFDSMDTDGAGFVDNEQFLEVRSTLSKSLYHGIVI